jgi:hypothetical protein
MKGNETDHTHRSTGMNCSTLSMPELFIPSVEK